MTGAPKISACVDCAVSIIGERLRCPACHDQHASVFATDEDAVTAPRGLVKLPTGVWQSVLLWILGAGIFALLAAALMAVGRSCR